MGFAAYAHDGPAGARRATPRRPRGRACWIGLAAAALLFAWGGARPAEARPKAPAPPARLGDEASLRLARALRASGDAAAALPIYRNLAKGLPADAPLTIELGDVLLDARLIDDAMGIYAAAPGSARAQLGLARAQLTLGQAAKALPYADRAVQLAPADGAVLILRGVVLDRLGRHAEAQASYRAVLTVTPQSVAARSNLALSLALTGQFPEALEILEPIARSANATPRDRQNLAFVYGLKGDAAAARALGEVDLDARTAADNAEFLALAHDQMATARP